MSGISLTISKIAEHDKSRKKINMKIVIKRSVTDAGRLVVCF